MNRLIIGSSAFGICFFTLFPESAHAAAIKAGYVLEDSSVIENLTVDGVTQGHYRKVLDIPRTYGTLISVIPGGEGTIFWFQNDRGEIRNVSFDASSPMIIRRAGTSS